MSFWWLYVPQGTQKSFAEGFVSSFWGFSFSLTRLIASCASVFFLQCGFQGDLCWDKKTKMIFLKQHLQPWWTIHCSEMNCTLPEIIHNRPDWTWQSSYFLCSSYTACESGQCKIIKYSTVCNGCSSSTVWEKMLSYVFLKNLGRIVMWLHSWSVFSGLSVFSASLGVIWTQANLMWNSLEWCQC